jgi:hypothetical protein
MAPWTALWERNFFAGLLPWLGDWMANGYVRGGVTGIGLVTTVVGLRDLAGSFLHRSSIGRSPDETA